jgi:hypothetical protein
MRSAGIARRAVGLDDPGQGQAKLPEGLAGSNPGAKDGHRCATLTRLSSMQGEGLPPP